MAYADVLRRIGSTHLLHSVLLELTFNCNLNCFICYNEREKLGDRLTFDDYRRILADLASLGTMNLTLSGGEPLVHADFFQLGALARKLGFVVRIKSNGNLLDESLAKRVKEDINPYYIELSLHGAMAATHDRQTRVPGSYHGLMDNIRVMRKMGLALRFNTPLTQWNQMEFKAMNALADDLKIPIRFDFQLTPRDSGDLEPLAIAPSQAVLNDYISHVGLAVSIGEPSDEGDSGNRLTV